MADSNYLTIAKYLMAHGYSRAAAAGIAGTIAGESGGNPESEGSGGRGLIGWTPPSKLPDSAFTGDPQHDLTAQLAQVLVYNNAQGSSLVEQLKKQTSPIAAADFFSQRFERPRVTDSDVRSTVVDQVYKELGGTPVGNEGSGGQPAQATLTAAEGSGLIAGAGSFLHGSAVVLDRAFAMFAPGQGWRLAFGAAAVVLLFMSFRAFTGVRVA